MSNFELFAKIGGDSSNLQRALGNANKKIGGVRKAMRGLAVVGAAGFKALAAGATAAVGALGLMTRAGLSSVDSQAKLARSLNTSVDSLKAMQIVASDAGIDGLDMSLARLNRRLGAAEQGIGEYKRTIDALNLSATELQELPIDERLAVIADAVRESGISMQQAARHAQTLGFEQANAAALFMQGGKQIRAARQEVEDFGMSITGIEAAQVEEANDQFTRVGRILQIVQERLAIIVAGPMAVLSERLIEAGKNTQGFQSVIEPALVAIARMFAKIGDLVVGMKAAYNLFGSVVLDVGATIIRIQNKITGALTGTVSAAMTGIEAMINLANKVPGINIPTDGIEAFKASVDGIVPRFEQMANSFEKRALEMATKAYESLGNALPSEMLEGFLEDVREWRANFEAEFEGAGQSAGEKIKAPVEKELTEMEQFGVQAARNMQNAFANFLIDPFKDGLKGMLQSFVKMLNEMVAQIIAKKALTSFFSSFAGGDGVMANIANAFLGGGQTGANATGGPMMARQPYMVGEKGPELVVPSKSSYVVPNNKMGGGGGVNLSVNINAEDPGAEGRIRTMIERDMAPQIIEAATGNTMNRLQRPRFA